MGSAKAQALAERYNGKEWSIQTTPNPTGATNVKFAGVSCPSTEACTAVGHYTNSLGKVVTFGERWNGKEWSIQTTPTPAEAKSSELAGVACPSTEACTAVGRYTNSAGSVVMLAEGWNGKEWSIQTTPSPVEAKGSELTGVSCTSTEVCTAVGGYTNSAGSVVTLAERWNGKEWAVQTTANPETKGSVLLGVSCYSAEGCFAVGKTNPTISENLAERLSGSSWSLSSVPGVPVASAGVSCQSSSSCFAVGTAGAGFTGSFGLIRFWNGTVWSNSEPAIRSVASSVLSGVACPASGNCTVVGHYTNSSGSELAFAQRYSSGEWHGQSIPDPAEALSARFTAVSCPSGEACTAVGTATVGAKAQALAEHYNGKEWSIQTTPNPAGATNVTFAGVSCPSTEACTAVGHYTNAGGKVVTFGERWNGKEWSIQTTLSRVEAKSSELTGVSCTSAEACTAVGRFTNSAGTVVPLAESWNGKEWSYQTTPSPVEAKGSELTGVSCISTEACTAVGGYTNSAGGVVTLAESWNGKEWAVQTTANPETKGSVLLGVSCYSAEGCVAVGKTNPTISENLAELYH